MGIEAGSITQWADGRVQRLHVEWTAQHLNWLMYKDLLRSKCHQSIEVQKKDLMECLHGELVSYVTSLAHSLKAS